MSVEIDVAGTENETPSELKRVRAQLMLPMPACLRARPRFRIVTSKQMQKVRRLQACGAIREPLLVDQQRKRDSSLLAKQARVAHIAKADSREIGALGSELPLMVAQLRNMLAAEDSSVVAKEDDHRRAAFPQRTKPNFAPISVGKRNIGKRSAERLSHRPDPSTIHRESTKNKRSAWTDFPRSSPKLREFRLSTDRLVFPQNGGFRTSRSIGSAL